MTVLFTADTHFGHADIIRYCKSPQLMTCRMMIVHYNGLTHTPQKCGKIKSNL